MHRTLVLLANLLWFLATLPEAFRFRLALHHPARVQRRLRLRLLRRLAAPAAVSPTDYEDLLPEIERIRKGERQVLTLEDVCLLEPTGGTTGGTKLIPYTPGLRREYARAIAPWICRLYLRHPGLFLGRQYWCITPAATVETNPDGPPVGFAEDAEYLGGLQAAIARRLLVAPAELRLVRDQDTFEHITLLFLLAAEDLALVSVWHPSFLTLLLDQLPARREALVRDLRAGRAPHLPPAPRRARQLADADLGPDADLTPLWPRLRLISCWAGPQHRPWLDRLARRFPGCPIEPKGLMATEGITTIPWGDRHIPAIRAHVLEFETDDGAILGFDGLREGMEAGVLLSTSGGLYRYRTHDRVRVGPTVAGTPSLTFLGRDNHTVDLFGEKLAERHVRDLLADLPAYHFLAPCQTDGSWHYSLFAGDGPHPSPEQLAAVEEGLCRNFHYAHARRLGQLGPLRLCRVPGDLAARVRARLIAEGRRSGALKLPALRPETDWPQFLAARQSN